MIHFSSTELLSEIGDPSGRLDVEATHELDFKGQVGVSLWCNHI